VQDTLSKTNTAIVEGEEQVKIKLRAKDVENERLLKILQEMDSAFAKNGMLKEAVGMQQVCCLPHQSPTSPQKSPAPRIAHLRSR
jgi:hypothetical protein